MDGLNGSTLPRWRCHKVVEAFKIQKVITHLTGGVTLVSEDEAIGSFTVDDQYVVKHNPQAGGYYVRYEDGYSSWSPANAFEDGYTPIA